MLLLPILFMRLAITGTPGTGKTAIAKALGQKIGHRALNEKELALQHGIGEWDAEENELVVPLKKLEKAANSLLKKEQKVIIEGHLLCEMKLKADFVVVLRLHPELLEERLSRKRYSPEKIMDNVFCEGIDYCKKHALRNYRKEKVLDVQAQKTIKETMQLIISKLKRKGAEI